MPNRHSTRFLLFLFLMIASLVLVGCSDDDEDIVAVDDPGASGGDGDIFIETDPAIVQVPWTLTRPGGETSAGVNDQRFRQQDHGVYSISWPELPGWNEPRPRTVEQTLNSGSNLLFSAIYLPLPGTAVVQVIPEGMDASWRLSKMTESYNPVPIEYLSYAGDTTLVNLVPGDYEMIWFDMDGFEFPDTMYVTVNPAGPLHLLGEYSYPDSTLLINPTPLDIDAPWTLDGVDGFSDSGNGQTKVDIEFSGEYTVTWLEVAGRITPEAETLFIQLEEGRIFYLSGDYMATGGTVNVTGTIGGTSMPWDLTNPNGGIQHGEGDAQLTSMQPGQYSIEWLALDGWVPAATVELELPGSGDISFTAAPEAAITVIPLPAELYATWTLSGPGGYSLDGQGEQLVDGLTAGSYTITWNGLDGWGGPAASSQTLAADNGLVFQGEYAQVAQTIHVNPLPVSLDISWAITGPGGFSEQGTGKASIPVVDNGQYTIAWAEIDGYMQPGPQMLEYSGDGNLNFRADYLETLDLVNISSGSFTYGSSFFEPCRSGFEQQNEIDLTFDFIMKATEVTNAQYIALAQWACDRGYATANMYGVNDNLDGSTVELLDLDDGDQEIFFEDGVFRCIRPNQPVKEVSWYGAASYCDWLSMYRGLERSYSHVTWKCGTTHPSQAFGFRLPTEAEWEYACRAGSTSAYANGSINRVGELPCYANDLDEIAWYDDCAESWSHDVGLKLDNDWGLYDMHGNVMEWCNDWYEETYMYYIEAFGPLTNPPGPLTGTQRVARGGYFYSPVEDCRSASRFAFDPSNASYDTGFRFVLTGE